MWLTLTQGGCRGSRSRSTNYTVTYEASLIQDNQKYIKKTCPKGEKRGGGRGEVSLNYVRTFENKIKDTPHPTMDKKD